MDAEGQDGLLDFRKGPVLVREIAGLDLIDHRGTFEFQSGRQEGPEIAPAVALPHPLGASATQTMQAREETGANTDTTTRTAERMGLAKFVPGMRLVGWDFALGVEGQPEVDGVVALVLLTNIYRSFDYRQESTIYDQPAISVTGEQLNEILRLKPVGGTWKITAIEVNEEKRIY